MSAALDLDCYDDEDFSENASETSPEQERELLLFATGFFSELNYIVRGYMTDFFKNETFSQGGKIPYSLLLSNKNVSMVMNYDIIRSVDEAYHRLSDFDLSCGSPSDTAEDIKLVVGILDKLAQANIPQQLAGGMMLLYLDLVEGVDFG